MPHHKLREALSKSCSQNAKIKNVRNTDPTYKANAACFLNKMSA